MVVIGFDGDFGEVDDISNVVGGGGVWGLEVEVMVKMGVIVVAVGGDEGGGMLLEVEGGGNREWGIFWRRKREVMGE